MEVMTMSHGEQQARVLLVDHQPIYRAGFRQLVQQAGMRVVAEADSAHQAMRACDEARPDVVLLEAILPGVNGLVTAAYLRRDHPQVRIVVLGMGVEPAVIASAIRVGAVGFIPKSSDPERALEVLAAVDRGENLLEREATSDPAVMSMLVSHLRSGAHERQRVGSPDLSPRELEVLDCLLMGYANKEIAEALYITEQTVKNHMTSVLRKLSVSDRVAALRIAMANGWGFVGMPALIDDPVPSAAR
jgi:two-component system response regulator DegU